MYAMGRNLLRSRTREIHTSVGVRFCVSPQEDENGVWIVGDASAE